MDIFKEIERSIADIQNPVILLEGKRNVLEEDKIKLINFAENLAKAFPEAIFRSGNADGSDFLFIQGIKKLVNTRIELVVPYKGHKRKNIPPNAGEIALNDLDFTKETYFVTLTKQLLSARSGELIDKYIDDNKQITKATGKASYLLRDTVKVVGVNEFAPANFGIFYDDLQNPESGGTGFTMLVCRTLNVPYIKQDKYF